MKKFILACLFLLGCAVTCPAQTVQNLNDMSLLEANKTKYIDKPLSFLLVDIKPEAQLFFTNVIHVGKGVISFYFVDYNRLLYLDKEKKKPTRILVSVDGTISENDYSLPLESRFVWTQADKQKNQYLIVKNILVRVGED